MVDEKKLLNYWTGHNEPSLDTNIRCYCKKKIILRLGVKGFSLACAERKMFRDFFYKKFISIIFIFSFKLSLSQDILELGYSLYITDLKLIEINVVNFCCC